MTSRTILASHLVVLGGSLLLATNRALPQEASKELQPLHRIDAQTAAGLQSLFQRTAEPLPFVSAHRGGPQAGFPENCIPTFENTLRHTFSILEIDPRYAKDGAIVVHHDPTLERTTTGKGRVVDFTLTELKQLRLKDN